jgi:hypothetical protein
MLWMVAEHVVVWAVVAAAVVYLGRRMWRSVGRRRSWGGGCGTGCGTCPGGSRPQNLVALDPPPKQPAPRQNA